MNKAEKQVIESIYATLEQTMPVTAYRDVEAKCGVLQSLKRLYNGEFKDKAEKENEA